MHNSLMYLVPPIGRGIVNTIFTLISPLAFIWSVNTLFNVGIPISFKTWFAGLLLILVVKFHLRTGRTYDDPIFFRNYQKEENQEHEDDDDEEQIADSEVEAEPAEERLDEKLMRYKRERERQRRKKR